MQTVEFRPAKRNYAPIKKFKKPHLRFELYSIDHQLIQYSDLTNATNWSRSYTCTTVKYKGRTLVGLPNNSAYSSVNLTGTITLVETGDYLVNVIGIRSPSCASNAQLSVSVGGSVLKNINTKHTYQHPHVFDFGVHRLTSGSKSFVITVPKFIQVWAIAVYKINKYIGKSGSLASRKRLDVMGVSDLTHNIVNELDTAKVDIAMHSDYLRPEESFSGYTFEFWDIVNIYMGNKSDSKNMLGGYVIDVIPDEDKLKLEIGSHYADLLGEPIYNNLAIGINPRSDETPQFPHKQFSSALETCRYLVEAADEVGITLREIVKPHGYELNFAEQDDFDAAHANGYHKQQISPVSGIPCMKVTLDMDAININDCGVTNQVIELVFFDDPDNPWNAAVDQFHGLKYMAPSCATSASTMMQWNLGITMYKAGQTAANAIEYNIRWTGKSGSPHLIGSMTYTLNNKTQISKFDLKAAFDKYAKSTAYYVTKVRLWNTVTSNEVTNHDKMVMYLDNPISYASDVNAKMHLDQGSDKPFNLLKQILNEIDYVSYINYGKYRCDDRIIFAPLENQASAIEISESENVLDIFNQEYNPMEYLANRVLCYYHYTQKDVDKTGKSFTENLDSYFHFRRPWGYFEDLSDVSSQVDADKYSSKYLSKNAYPYKSYGIKMEGTTLINLSDFVLTKIDNKALSGYYGLKDLIYNMNFEEDGFTTQVDAGRASDYFYDVVMKMYDKIERYKHKDNRNVYDNRSLKVRGMTGVGSIIKSGSSYSNV